MVKTKVAASRDLPVLPVSAVQKDRKDRKDRRDRKALAVAIRDLPDRSAPRVHQVQPALRARWARWDFPDRWDRPG